MTVIRIPIKAAASDNGRPAESLSYELRRISPDDYAYVRATWREGHKSAPSCDRMPWSLYKQTIGKTIDGLVESDDVRLLGAYSSSNHVLGWIAYTPGSTVSTVHWTHTRFESDGEQMRRRGIMTQLFDAADLGRRVAYTFRSGRPRGKRDGSERLSLDELLARWMRSRGVSAAYVDIREWLR